MLMGGTSQSSWLPTDFKQLWQPRTFSTLSLRTPWSLPLRVHLSMTKLLRDSKSRTMLINRTMKAMPRKRSLETKLAPRMKTNSTTSSNLNFRKSLLFKRKLHLSPTWLRPSRRVSRIKESCLTTTLGGWATLHSLLLVSTPSPSLFSDSSSPSLCSFLWDLDTLRPLLRTVISGVECSSLNASWLVSSVSCRNGYSV